MFREVSQENMAEPGCSVSGNQIGGLPVGQVTQLTGDSGFQGNWIGSVDQHVLVVVAFDNQDVRFAHCPAEMIGDFSGIGQVEQRSERMAEMEGTGFGRIVPGRQNRDDGFPQLDSVEVRQRVENRIGCLRKRKRSGCSSGQKNGNGILLEKLRQAGDVINVFMGDKHCVDLRGGKIAFLQPLTKLSIADAQIDEKIVVIELQKKGVAF